MPPARLSQPSRPRCGARDLDAGRRGAGRRLGTRLGIERAHGNSRRVTSVMRTGPQRGRPPDRAARAPDHLDRCDRRRIRVLHVARTNALLKIVNAPLAHEDAETGARGQRAAGVDVPRCSRAPACWPSRSSRWPPRLPASRSGVSAATRAAARPRDAAAWRRAEASAGGSSGRQTGHARIGEPFTTTIGIALAVRADPVAAGRALPALRLPAAGVQPRAARRRHAADAGDPVPVCGRRAVRYFVVLPAAVRFFPELQQRPVQRARAGPVSTTTSPP